LSVTHSPVRRQTYGYIPAGKGSPLIGCYQIILPGNRGTCTWTCLESLPEIAAIGSNLRHRKSCTLTTSPPNHTWLTIQKLLDATSFSSWISLSFNSWECTAVRFSTYAWQNVFNIATPFYFLDNWGIMKSLLSFDRLA